MDGNSHARAHPSSRLERRGSNARALRRTRRTRASEMGCPVIHSPAAAETASAAAAAQTSGGDSAAAAAGSASTSGCPVHARGSPAGERLNPDNAMPAVANQLPAAGQRLPLSKERVESTIPQAGAEGGHWVYPSAQMFYNAMRRKGFEPQEEDMRTVVAIHNTVNERTWREILLWERHYPECVDDLKLVRFGGVPDEPTPKARLFTAVGYKPPFDRHDWVVSRCGREVRYLIDYYNARPIAGKPVAMHIDARPAADDLQGAWERVRMPFLRLWNAGRGP
mmetsp:Transcript_12847/g.41843  ORF Transcript_12847/g.41843 Transcript_12847/m.41843 type:complete len:280 (+) Transcript_12847:178-1017(+)